MKKSTNIVLAAVFAAAIASCKEKAREDEWTTGADQSGRVRDTVSHNRPYRYFGGLWYPIIGGLISPSTYTGASYNQIRTPGFRPVHNTSSFRRGGFGSSSHHSSGS